MGDRENFRKILHFINFILVGFITKTYFELIEIVPDKIPTKYAFDGTPTKWAGKGTFVIFLIVSINHDFALIVQMDF